MQDNCTWRQCLLLVCVGGTPDGYDKQMEVAQGTSGMIMICVVSGSHGTPTV